MIHWRKGLSYAKLGVLFCINIAMRTLARVVGSRNAAATYREQYGGDGYEEPSVPAGLWTGPGPVHVAGGACTGCGACLVSCPAFLARRGPDAGTLPFTLARTVSRSPTEAWAAADLAFACAGCRNCDERCPESIPITAIAASLKAAALEAREAPVPPAHRRAIDNVRLTGNVYGRPPRGFPEFESPRAEWVVFLGCMGNYRQRRSAHRTLDLLRRLGLDFSTIREWCSGGFLMDCGLGSRAFRGSEENLRAIEAKGTRRVVAQCPTCVMALSRLPGYRGRLEVVPMASLLARLETGRVRVPAGGVAYHDACRLGRGLGVYDDPRRVIARMGATLCEIDPGRERADCSGFGGGFSAVEPEAAHSAALARLARAKAVGAGALVTECWGARAHLARAARRAGLTMEVATLADLLHKGIDDGGP